VGQTDRQTDGRTIAASFNAPTAGHNKLFAFIILTPPDTIRDAIIIIIIITQRYFTTKYDNKKTEKNRTWLNLTEQNEKNFSSLLSLQFVLCIFTTHYIQLHFTIVYFFVFFPIFILFFDPGTQFPGNEKIMLCNKEKYKNQAGMNLTPTPSQNSRAVRWHCIAESERRVAEIKSWFLCRRPTDQQACDRVSKGRRDPRQWLDPMTQRQLAYY